MKFFPSELIDDRYRVISLLNDGDASRVYLALDQLLQIKVVVKHLFLGHHDAELSERFNREARALSGLSDKNIVRVHRYGFLKDSSPFIVLDYVEGVTLRQLLESAPLPLNDATKLAIQIVHALRAAAQHGIVHRDLKPENILVKESSLEVCLIDFGLCKQIEVQESDATITVRWKTGPGVSLGSPAYMSPEQCLKQEADSRSDIYSFGLIFYEMLVGEQAFFQAENMMELFKMQINQMVPALSNRYDSPDSTMRALDNIIAACCSKNKENRPTCDSLLDSLGNLLPAPDGWSLSQFKKVKVRTKSDKKSRRLYVLGATVILVLATALVYLHLVPSGKSVNKGNPIELAFSEARKGNGEKAVQIISLHNFGNEENETETIYQLFLVLRESDPSSAADCAILWINRATEQSVRKIPMKDSTPISSTTLAEADELSTFLRSHVKTLALWKKVNGVLSRDVIFGEEAADALRCLNTANLFFLRAHSALHLRTKITQAYVENHNIASDLCAGTRFTFLKLYPKPLNLRTLDPEFKGFEEETKLCASLADRFEIHMGSFYGHLFLAEIALSRAQLEEADNEYKLCLHAAGTTGLEDAEYDTLLDLISDRADAYFLSDQGQTKLENLQATIAKLVDIQKTFPRMNNVRAARECLKKAEFFEHYYRACVFQIKHQNRNLEEQLSLCKRLSKETSLSERILKKLETQSTS